MPAYVIVSYDIVDPAAYEAYVPGVLPLLAKHGAEVLVAEYDATALEGDRRGVHVVLRFPSVEAARAWYDDPAYEPVKKIRLGSCAHGSVVLANAFVPPGA